VIEDESVPLASLAIGVDLASEKSILFNEFEYTLVLHRQDPAPWVKPSISQVHVVFAACRAAFSTPFGWHQQLRRHSASAVPPPHQARGRISRCLTNILRGGQIYTYINKYFDTGNDPARQKNRRFASDCRPVMTPH
jgi:hypothetical protein